MGFGLVSGGGDGWRGIGRATAIVAILCVAGCGKSGEGAVTDPEKGSDAEILNMALSRELTMLDAYTRGRSQLGGSLRAMGRQLRAHEQEYVNALTKAIRGVGGDVEAEAEELDFSRVRERADLLALLYELESAALASYLEAPPRLFTAAPRTLAASLAAGHAQHLVVLRQALGAGLGESVPEPFDGGEVEPPLAVDRSGGG